MIKATYLGKPVSIPVESITHFIAADKVVEIHHAGGVHMLCTSLDRLSKKLEGFVRISRSALVRADQILRIERKEKDRSSGLAYCAFGGEPLTVSRKNFMPTRRATGLLPTKLASSCKYR